MCYIGSIRLKRFADRLEFRNPEIQSIKERRRGEITKTVRTKCVMRCDPLPEVCQRASALHARSKHVLKYSTRNATMCERNCLTLLGIDDINKGSHKRVVSSNTTYEALCLEA